MTKHRYPTLNIYQIACVLIMIFTFMMSLLVSERVFERLPHLEDEVAYLYQARIFAGGQIVVDSPQPTGAFWQPFVVDSDETGKRFSKYTPGWSALLAIGVLLGYEQIINALFATLTVALVFRLGREIFNNDVGTVAALLVACSPAALLLNGTLMSHSSGLFLASLFIYAYWRLEKGRIPNFWAIIAGIALGLLTITRPLTALGVGLPFIVWSGMRSLDALWQWVSKKTVFAHTKSVIVPLLILSIVASIFLSAIPAFSYAATGDATQNLYELVWDYDRIGFGDCCGRNQHRLEKALNHARFDLSLTAADLFGWQFEPVTQEMIDHLQTDADFYEGTGYSFYLLPLGLILGLGLLRVPVWRIGMVLTWSIGAFFWVWMPLNLRANFLGLGLTYEVFNLPLDLAANFTFSWIWIAVALIWLFLPMLVWYRQRKTPQIPYTWLLWSVVLSVVIIQMLYWIGSQRYSTRYYYEALTAAALISAIPIASLIRFGARKVTARYQVLWKTSAYSILLIVCAFTLINYSQPRIMALYRFNDISPELIEQVYAARTDDRPILAIISGTTTGDNRVRWRSHAALMAVTSPYLDSEIVAARTVSITREELIERFPDRQVVDIFAVGNDATVAPTLPD